MFEAFSPVGSSRVPMGFPLQLGSFQSSAGLIPPCLPSIISSRTSTRTPARAAARTPGPWDGVWAKMPAALRRRCGEMNGKWCEGRDFGWFGGSKFWDNLVLTCFDTVPMFSLGEKPVFDAMVEILISFQRLILLTSPRTWGLGSWGWQPTPTIPHSGNEHFSQAQAT